MVKYPANYARGGVDRSLVNNLDVTATIADVAGAYWFDHEGISMLSGVKRTGLPLEAAVYTSKDHKGPLHPGYCGYRWNPSPGRDYQFVQYADGSKELYDYNKDPYELKNLAGSRNPDYKRVEAKLQVKALESCQGANPPAYSLVQKFLGLNVFSLYS